MAASAWAGPVDDALAQSKKTGIPVLAVAGTKSCPSCVSLKEKLGSPSMRPLVSQFIPVNVDTEVDRESFSKLFQLKNPNTNFIPMVWVIRADGQPTFGGNIEGETSNFLQSQIVQTGRRLTPAQLSQLSSAVEQATKLNADGDVAGAVSALGKLIGSQSFAEPAVMADKLGEELSMKARAEVTAAQEKINQPATAFEGVLKLVETHRTYLKLPTMTIELNKMIRDLRAKTEIRPLIDQAQALDRAREMEVKDKGRARPLYRQVVDRYPNSPAAELAQARLDAIATETK